MKDLILKEIVKISRTFRIFALPLMISLYKVQLYWVLVNNQYVVKTLSLIKFFPRLFIIVNVLGYNFHVHLVGAFYWTFLANFLFLIVNLISMVVMSILQNQIKIFLSNIFRKNMSCSFIFNNY